MGIETPFAQHYIKGGEMHKLRDETYCTRHKPAQGNRKTDLSHKRVLANLIVTVAASSTQPKI